MPKIKEMILLKKLILIMAILFLSCNFIIAYDDSQYPETCGNTNDCNAGDTRLGQDDLWSVYSKPITDLLGVPLVADLDNDGNDEILVYGDGELKIYRYMNLTYIASDPKYRPVSNVLIMDLDDDGYKDIIFTNKTQAVILNFTDNVIGLKKNITLSDYFFQISCDDASNQCIGVGTTYAGGGQPVKHAFIGFNYTNKTGLGYSTSTSMSAGYCEPAIINPAAVDLGEDGSGDVEFIFTRISVSGGDLDSGAIVLAVNRNSSCLEGNCAPKQAWVSGANMGDFLPADAGTPFISCSAVNNAFADDAGLANTWATSPLVYDFADNSGKEVAVCFRYGTVTDNRCVTIKSNGQVLDYHPDILFGLIFDTFPGRYLSNLFLANAFDGNAGRDEYCVVSSGAVETALMIFCASERDTFNLNEGIYFFPSTSSEYRNYNLTGYDPAITTYEGITGSLLAHSIDAGASLDFNGQDQILTSYGVLVPNLKSVGFSTYETMIDFSTKATTNMSLVPVRFDNSTYLQLVGISPQNLFFIWDNYFKSGAYFNYSVDPCKNGGINNGTTVIVKMHVFDDDGGVIYPNVEYMYNNVNQQVINYTTGASNGQIVDFNFVANATGPNVIIRMCANSTSRPDIMNCESYTTSVVEKTGNNQGDCVDYGGTEPIVPHPTVTTTTLPNPVIQTFDGLAEVTGMASWIWWIILMIVLNVAIVIYIRMENVILFVLLGIFNTLMIILGTYFGYISLTAILIMATVGAFTIGVPLVLWTLSHGKSKGD
jgi:hypothetical protein